MTPVVLTNTAAATPTAITISKRTPLLDIAPSTLHGTGEGARDEVLLEGDVDDDTGMTDMKM